jgi:NADH dehydrogenase [ubiquinone] 1 alpha subcomplex assembly factor 1
MSRLLALAVATAAVILAAPAGGTAVSAGSTNALANPPTETTCLADPTPAPDSLMLFNFEDAGKAQWSVESDRVMGGRSSGSVQAGGGTLTFTGEVVTEGGGFSSVRAGRQVDLSGYDGIELRVRGGGRTFELDVSDGTESRGREVTRRGSFPTSGSWETVRVPFDALEESAHGEPVSAGPLDLSAVKSIGIYIIDGKDGPFRLEVDWIRAYRKDTHRKDAHREEE